jgi:hypothetical protein
VVVLERASALLRAALVLFSHCEPARNRTPSVAPTQLRLFRCRTMIPAERSTGGRGSARALAQHLACNLGKSNQLTDRHSRVAVYPLVKRGRRNAQLSSQFFPPDSSYDLTEEQLLVRFSQGRGQSRSRGERPRRTPKPGAGAKRAQVLQTLPPACLLRCKRRSHPILPGIAMSMMTTSRSKSRTSVLLLRLYFTFQIEDPKKNVGRGGGPPPQPNGRDRRC